MTDIVNIATSETLGKGCICWDFSRPVELSRRTSLPRIWAAQVTIETVGEGIYHLRFAIGLNVHT